MELTIELIQVLLVVASVVAMLVRRLKIPYTVGLVLAGIGLAFMTSAHDTILTKEMIFNLFLPGLIYEAAIYIHWNELRRDLLVIITYATLGVILSAIVTAAGMHVLASWPWQSALIFGVLIAATDPVSVIATFKEAGVQGRLRLLVEAESIFNDSTAAIGFVIALAFATGSQISVSETIQTLFASVAGGILSGLVVTGGLLLLVQRTEDHLVEITLTTVAAYGSFLLAEHFHASGVLASTTAGIITGNYGSLGSFTDKGREAVESFWEYVAFVINSLIFILIGIREAHQNFLLSAIPIAIIMVLLGRAVAIYPLSALFSRSALRIEKNHQHVLFWGGLRGALALALALGLPASVPLHDEIVTVAFGVVSFSLFVQGTSMTPLLRWLKALPETNH